MSKPTRYTVELIPTALGEIRSLPKPLRKLIGDKITRMQDGLTGDVKKLKGSKRKYRLRVGSHRVLFELEGNVIVIYHVGDRKSVYE
jgi:mRNA interferase RelE/StbE